MFLQVLRYSALGAGIFYGFYHQAKLSSAAKLAAIDREYKHKQSLIEQAKAEYSKKNLPPSAKTEGGDSTSIFPLALHTLSASFYLGSWGSNALVLPLSLFFSFESSSSSIAVLPSFRTVLTDQNSCKRPKRLTIRPGGIFKHPFCREPIRT